MRIGERVLERAARNALDRGGAGADGGKADAIDSASPRVRGRANGQAPGCLEILTTCMRDGARTWSDLQRALIKEDSEKMVSTCDGVPLRDLLLDLR